jgi:hypothetical protein
VSPACLVRRDIRVIVVVAVVDDQIVRREVLQLKPIL